MSKSEKEFRELLALAKEVKHESVFQQKNRYKKFKAKNHNKTHEIRPVFIYFVSGLLELKFYKEVIYWCTKMFKDVRICDSPERSEAFWNIAVSFCHFGDIEKVLEYGERYIKTKAVTRAEKLSSCSKNGVFFSAASCKKIHHFWCS